MEYKVEKVTALDGYRVFMPEFQCKEQWIFEANILGLSEKESPSEAFITHLAENYPSVKIFRQFFVQEETKQFAETCGLDVLFGVRKEAVAYAEELNSKSRLGEV